MAENDAGPDLSYRQQEIERARDALFGAQWRGYVAGALGGGGSGGFRVEPERLEAAISMLDGILLDLDKVFLLARTAKFDPPAFDDVSINAANNMALMTRRAASYVSAWVRELEATRVALQQELTDYAATDQSIAGQQA